LRFRWLESEMNVEESESGGSGRHTRPKRTELVGHQDQINSCTLEKTNHTLLVTSSRDLTVRVRVLSPLPRPAWPDTTELRHGCACTGVGYRGGQADARLGGTH
jgi:WD40 repeat protein